MRPRSAGVGGDRVVVVSGSKQARPARPRDRRRRVVEVREAAVRLRARVVVDRVPRESSGVRQARATPGADQPLGEPEVRPGRRSARAGTGTSSSSSCRRSGRDDLAAGAGRLVEEGRRARVRLVSVAVSVRSGARATRAPRARSWRPAGRVFICTVRGSTLAPRRSRCSGRAARSRRSRTPGRSRRENSAKSRRKGSLPAATDAGLEGRRAPRRSCPAAPPGRRRSRAKAIAPLVKSCGVLHRDRGDEPRGVGELGEEADQEGARVGERLGDRAAGSRTAG